jgi:hypothetical protein
MREIMKLFQYINPFISFTSLIIAIYAFKRTYSLNQEVGLLNFRKTLAEQSKPYADLLHRQYELLKEPLSNLSTVLSDTSIKIGHLLDKYDCRDAKKYKGYMKELRHLYLDLRKDILDRFKYELPWQTTENIWLFRPLSWACVHAAFSSTPHESACNSRASESIKRQ